MPVKLLTPTQRKKLSRFPSEIPREDLISHFSLCEKDMALIRTLKGDANKMGFVLQVSGFRYLGFVPGDLGVVPKDALRYLAGQLGVDPEALADYGQRPKTRWEHHLKAMEHLGIRRPSDWDFQRIQEWLTERALEHDRPIVLIEAACEKFKREHLVRAGITTVERMVARARSEAHEVSLRRLSRLLTKKCRAITGWPPPARGSRQTNYAGMASPACHV